MAVQWNPSGIMLLQVSGWFFVKLALYMTGSESTHQSFCQTPAKVGSWFTVYWWIRVQFEQCGFPLLHNWFFYWILCLLMNQGSIWAVWVPYLREAQFSLEWDHYFWCYLEAFLFKICYPKIKTMPLKWIDFNQQLFCCAKYLPCHSAPTMPLWPEL